MSYLDFECSLETTGEEPTEWADDGSKQRHTNGVEHDGIGSEGLPLNANLEERTNQLKPHSSLSNTAGHYQSTRIPQELRHIVLSQPEDRSTLACHGEGLCSNIVLNRAHKEVEVHQDIGNL